MVCLKAKQMRGRPQVGSFEMDAVFSELRRSIPVIQTKPPTVQDQDCDFGGAHDDIIDGFAKVEELSMELMFGYQS
jgi:hypothetical protein